MKAIIIDDSKQARKLLRLMLAELTPFFQVFCELEDASNAKNTIIDLKPDVIFLDIEMPGITGVQFAEDLHKNNISGAIVFTTAYNEYAINAFRLSATDYLLKPIQEDQLIEAIAKVSEHLKFKSVEIQLHELNKSLKDDKTEVLSVPIQGGYEYIPLVEIEYFEADGSYVRIVNENGKQKLISKNLKYFEKALNESNNFLRVHRSFSINMNCVKAYIKSNGGCLELRSGKVIPVSRERKQAVLTYLSIV